MALGPQGAAGLCSTSRAKRHSGSGPSAQTLGLMKRRLLLLAPLLPLLAWSATSMKTDLAGNPFLDQYSEEGFVDCVFRIVGRSETRDHYRLRLQASHGGQVVGMDVVVVKNIQGAFDAEMNLIKTNVYRRGVAFHRTGSESDRFVNSLAALYGKKDAALRMTKTETFTAIALHQGPLDMEREPVKIKVFGRDAEPLDEGAYNESFFNLDLRNGLVFWNEKDQEYREPLIRALVE
jgi:hypothetical protein